MSGLREYQNAKKRHAVQTVPTISDMVNHFTMPNNDGRIKGFRASWETYYAEYIGNIAMAKKLNDPIDIKTTHSKIAHTYIMMVQMWKASVAENGLWY